MALWSPYISLPLVSLALFKMKMPWTFKYTRRSSASNGMGRFSGPTWAVGATMNHVGARRMRRDRTGARHPGAMWPLNHQTHWLRIVRARLDVCGIPSDVERAGPSLPSARKGSDLSAFNVSNFVIPC